MWSETLKNGKVKFVERYKNPLTLKSQRVSVIMDKDTARTRKLAQAALNEKIDQALAGIMTPVKQENLRLSELVDLYAASQKTQRRASTCTRNYHACKSLMRILGEDTVVARLSAGYVNQKLQAEGEDTGTTNERITRLKALIRWGYKNDYIEDIRWLDKLEKEKDVAKQEKLEEKFLESEELKLLLDNMSVPKWRMLAELTALSGLRIGEAIALSDTDVDLNNREIHITKTRDAVNKATNYPKTEKSYRVIYMQDELYTLCRKIKLFMKQERFACGYNSDLFISDICGNYLNYYSYNKYLGEVSERVLEKPIKITSHVMRHTHVALMAEQGVSLEVISRRLGHSNSKITREIYHHVTKKMQEKDNQQLKDIKIL